MACQSVPQPKAADRYVPDLLMNAKISLTKAAFMDLFNIRNGWALNLTDGWRVEADHWTKQL